MNELLIKKNDYTYMTDYIFYGMMKDLNAELSNSPHYNDSEAINHGYFYYELEVVEWMLNDWLSELVASELYGKTIEGITFGDSFHEFFDAQWHYLRWYTEKRLSQDLDIYSKFFTEFFTMLREKRLCFVETGLDQISTSRPGMLIDSYLFPQTEVW